MSDFQFIRYEKDDSIALLTLDRPGSRNAQHAPFLDELDAAFRLGEADPDVKVIVLKANGPSFSSGHDIGTPEARAWQKEHPLQAGVADMYWWESERYLGYSRRWRDIPKPTIAAVHGYCIAGGLMLCWPCDLIVAADDARFSDPVVRMGIGGVEYHGHTWELGARKAKELLFTGQFIDAQEAHRLGMVNRVVPREKLLDETLALARQIAEMPAFALAMAKRAVNRTLDIQGQWNALEMVFNLHHLGHAHATLTTGSAIQGMDVQKMKATSGVAAG